MSTLELNGKDFATQTSSAEPVLASTVTGGAGLSGSTSLGTVTAGNLSNTNIVYPAGHIIKSSAVQQSYSSYYETTSDDYLVVPSFVLGPFTFTEGNKVWVLCSIEMTCHNGGQDSGMQAQMSTSSTDNTDLVGLPHKIYHYNNTNYQIQGYSEATFSNIFSPSGTSVTYYMNIKDISGGYAHLARNHSTVQFFEIQA